MEVEALTRQTSSRKMWSDEGVVSTEVTTLLNRLIASIIRKNDI